jgi:glycosyltransferase involved in cell wall biosynthesis
MIHQTEQRQPHRTVRPASAAPLTVAINSQINPNRGGGVESALIRLIEALHERPDSERYLLISTEEFRDDVARLAGEHQRTVSWPFPQTGFPGARKREGLWRPAYRHSGPLRRYVDGVHRRLWEHENRLSRNPEAYQADPVLRANGAQVVHFPYAVPFGTDLPFVYEPWDLQHRHLPDFFHRGEVAWRDRVYGDACRNAAYVVVATRWTRQDIVKQFGINPARIVVIERGPGVGARASDPETIARVRAQRDLPEGFAFFPAMSFPHKNHIRLLEALAILRDRHNLVVPLVGIGRIYRLHWPLVIETLDRFKLHGQVQLFGQVSEEELNAMFALARFMVFPSLFEGLGLPVLEAQQLGVPVLSSTASCLPEVAGDGALYFDPADPEAIAAAIRRVYEEPELLPGLVERGAENLQRFSWPAAAATFAACYRSAAGLPLDEEQAALMDAALAP